MFIHFYHAQSKAERINTVTTIFVNEVETHCQCGFSIEAVMGSSFKCFPGSSAAVTFRATLIDSPRFLTSIKAWIQTNGIIQFQDTVIMVDKKCQVIVTSLADTECTSQTTPWAIIGGAVGGVVLIIVIIIALIIIVALVLGHRKKKLIIQENAFEYVHAYTISVLNS